MKQTTTYFLSGSYYLEYPMGTDCSLWSRSGEQNYFPWKGEIFAGERISHYVPSKNIFYLEVAGFIKKKKKKEHSYLFELAFNLSFSLLVQRKVHSLLEKSHTHKCSLITNSLSTCNVQGTVSETEIITVPPFTKYVGSSSYK